MTNELEKLNQLVRSINRGGYFRCSICNTVSNEEIETDLGDFKSHMSFVNDPKDPTHFICITCSEEIDSLRQDYEYDDQEKELHE